MVGIPPNTRESVMTALFAKFQALSPTPFVTVSRKLKLWNEVPAEAQPALFMCEHMETQVSTTRGLPSKTEWDIQLFLYATVNGDGQIGSVILNNLLDAVDGALKEEVAENVLTLGGRVYRVWGDGEIHKEPGDLDGQAIAIYPFKIRPP